MNILTELWGYGIIAIECVGVGFLIFSISCFIIRYAEHEGEM